MTVSQFLPLLIQIALKSAKGLQHVKGFNAIVLSMVAATAANTLIVNAANAAIVLDVLTPLLEATARFIKYYSWGGLSPS